MKPAAEIESIHSLFDWAHETHGIGRFIASISPDKAPSLQLAARLGFEQVGEQMDEIDGLELVFETTWPHVAVEPVARTEESSRWNR